MKRRNILDVDAYPLQWPAGWQRTPRGKRRRSRYQISFTRARTDAVKEVRLLKADDVVISTNVPIAKNGLPRVSHDEPDDPGVAVYWTSENGTRVIACDAWRTVRENLRAVALTVGALRQIERTGASEILDRAFQGFAALPAAGHSKRWRDVLGFEPDERVAADEIDDRYRELARKHHPDRGGDHETMARLNTARTEALQEVGA